MDIIQFLERAASFAHHNPALKELASQQSKAMATAFVEKNTDKLKRQIFTNCHFDEANYFAHNIAIFDQSNG